MTRQLAFELPLRTARGRADFFVAPSNAAALAAVEGWRDWPGGRLLLTGRPGAGKSHLAQVWAGLVPGGAAAVTGADMAAAEVPALAAGGAVLVEAAEGAAGAGEVALFHLLNLLGQTGGHILMTSRLVPRDWALGLPDLASRVEAMPMARLEAPCDALLSAVLVKLFADRQLAVSPAVIAHLVVRMERSLAAAQRLVARMDALSLARKGGVTRALADAALAEQEA
ncbi:MAG: chromosomal replication initiator DnaA [Gemmobacter sp.]